MSNAFKDVYEKPNNRSFSCFPGRSSGWRLRELLASSAAPFFSGCWRSVTTPAYCDRGAWPRHSWPRSTSARSGCSPMLRRRRVFIEKSNRPIEWRDARNYKPLLPMAERWTLDDLRVFCAVAETGSLTSAAAAVGLSLPAVSARLKALEQTFAATLCQRSHKGVALTPAGNRLHAHARDLLEKASLVTEDVSEYGSAARGIVRVVSNT